MGEIIWDVVCKLITEALIGALVFTEEVRGTNGEVKEVVGGELKNGDDNEQETEEGMATEGINTEVITGVTREVVTMDERDVVCEAVNDVVINVDVYALPNMVRGIETGTE